jgi:hypothetical protein
MTTLGTVENSGVSRFEESKKVLQGGKEQEIRFWKGTDGVCMPERKVTGLEGI